jgi:predicted ATP-dependent serine protease
MSKLVDSVVAMSDVDLSKPALRYFDVGFFNAVFGKGWAYPSLTILSGPPGAGKTTLALQLIERAMVNDDSVDAIYCTNEQTSHDLAILGKRLEIGNSAKRKIGILDKRFASLTSRTELLYSMRPRIFVVDSDGSTGNMRDMAVELDAAIIVIVGVDKEGNPNCDDESLQSADMTLGLDIDGETGERSLFSYKNRFAPAPLEIRLTLGNRFREIPSKQ